MFRQGDFSERIQAASRESELLRGTARAFPKSRWQNLNTLSAALKRDDELSLTMSGVKFRKLCGMTSLLKTSDVFASCGSSRSAFLFALAQLCIQLGKELHLYLLESTPWQDFGTDKLYRAVFERFPITWVSRADWPNIAALLPEDKPFIPEGGVGEGALWGAMSLGLDIAEQMPEEPWANIWIDAGTGLSAQALIYSLGEVLEFPPHVQVVLCAGEESIFRNELAKYPYRQAPFTLHRPPTAKSYGSTNSIVRQTVERYLKTEGVLLDPIYTAKLLLAFEANPTDKSLIIHSGGGLNNFGFR